MNRLSKLISGRVGAPVTLLLGLIFAALAFGPLAADKSDGAPGVGLPSTNETVLVDKALASLPGQDGSAAVIIYRTVDGKQLSPEDTKWLVGEVDPMSPVTIPVGGANELFTKWSNVEVNGAKIVPPVTISDDKTAAIVTVPMDKIAEVKDQTARVEEMRSAMSEGMPSTLEAKLTGPEGFVADISNVFAGADFALLGTTALVVMVLLLITYRSPSLWLIPLLIVGTADGMAGGLATRVAGWFDVTLDASITGILSVLVFGAGTDYALLLISRYREELLAFDNRRDAMARAWRESAPAILASGGTVVLALLTLSFATLEGNRGLGLACATGVLIAMISALFVLPAALVTFGRWIFWPLTPKKGGINKSDSGLWAKLGKGVSKRPVFIAIGGFVVLAALAFSGTGIKVGLSSTEQFLKKPEAVIGQEWIGEKFAAGSTVPTVVVANNDKVNDVVAAASEVAGVASAEVATDTQGKPVANAEITKINVVLEGEAGSQKAYDSIVALRKAVHSISGADAKVGGQDAQQLDVKSGYASDQALVIPLILALVFVVLLLLLRSVVAPVLLLITVVASFFASMGAGWLLFQNVFGFPALDLSVFLFSFLFLVALGVDYNIFLVTRAQEEGAKLGLRNGMIKALSSTGGVITSAGILLAAVFAVLGVLPLIALTQIGVIVCIGVLLDTLLVRTVIVPALAFIAGEKFWWPRKAK
ncbi:MAG: MMPL family transporter [Rhodoluna sp.]|nr:MMPL family transporter [Rhodoluna sp.]